MDVMLRRPSLRRRLIFELRQRYFHELECHVPLGHGLVCPIHRWQTWGSFRDIFFQHEYARAFTAIPIPHRWIDIGCYAGFFSMFVLWLRAERGLRDDCRALMIDADSRSAAAVEQLIALNGLEKQFVFKRGVISAAGSPRIFVEREFGTASIGSADAANDGEATLVAPLTPSEILSLLPPPYDLVKVDIEGGEFEFLTEYGEVLRQARHVLLEWHAWHPGGGGVEQLQRMLADRDFEFVDDVLTPAAAPHRARESGVRLYRRRGLGRTPA